MMLCRVARASFSSGRLSPEFREKYARKKVPFGFNGMGEFVYHRTYARTIIDEKNGESRPEQWHETIARVVEGASEMLEAHNIEPLSQDIAEQMYDAFFNMRALPPGRGLWAMGTQITRERKIYAALNNCAFISTEKMSASPAEPFSFLLDASMLGIGVGFDTRGAGTLSVLAHPSRDSYPHVVADSREGWVQAYVALINYYLVSGTPRPMFDFSQVRPAGAPIKGFGGVSGGPQPLIDLIETSAEILESHRGNWISDRIIVDLMNLIGKAVISGNVRRTAEIAFGRHDSEEFLNLKNYNINPERAGYGWTSNNSIFAEIGMDYTQVANRICDNGEPGLVWLHNMRHYSRMGHPPDEKDKRVMGSNPCVEQTLEDGELCCLVETFPMNCANLSQWLNTLELAFTYAKIVTLGMTPWDKTNEIISRNRRIGTSISGIAQFASSRGLETLRQWCEIGYAQLDFVDLELSTKYNVPLSVKKTSVKPSGTVSLLAGATPGIHFPISPYYIRRVRVPYNNPLLKNVVSAGYHIEPDVNDPNTAVVSFPIFVGDENVPSLQSVSIWEQFQMASFMQQHWADNSVSCTITFNPETEGPALKRCLDHYQYHLKGISILPNSDKVFPQMPYERITKEQYEKMCKHITSSLHLDHVTNNEPHVSEYCDGDSCTRQ